MESLNAQGREAVSGQGVWEYCIIFCYTEDMGLLSTMVNLKSWTPIYVKHVGDCRRYAEGGTKHASPGLIETDWHGLNTAA
jgi:hypothetical protein